MSAIRSIQAAILAILAVGLNAALAVPASAQSYPSKPIHIVVPSGAVFATYSAPSWLLAPGLFSTTTC